MHIWSPALCSMCHLKQRSFARRVRPSIMKTTSSALFMWLRFPATLPDIYSQQRLSQSQPVINMCVWATRWKLIPWNRCHLIIFDHPQPRQQPEGKRLPCFSWQPVTDPHNFSGKRRTTRITICSSFFFLPFFPLIFLAAQVRSSHFFLPHQTSKHFWDKILARFEALLFFRPGVLRASQVWLQAICSLRTCARMWSTTALLHVEDLLHRRALTGTCMRCFIRPF